MVLRPRKLSTHYQRAKFARPYTKSSTFRLAGADRVHMPDAPRSSSDILQMPQWALPSDTCPATQGTWSSWYWAGRCEFLKRLRYLEAATGASGEEIGIVLSFSAALVAVGAVWWWWSRRVKVYEGDVLVLTRGHVVKHAGRDKPMQTAPLEVFR
jgi:hypothetical protein